MKRFILLLLLLPMLCSADKIYQTITEDGKIIFSDTPTDKYSEEVDLPEIQSFPSESGAAEASAAAAAEQAYDAEFLRYESLTLTAPEEVMRDGDPKQKKLLITVNLTPGLQDGDKLQLMLDGVQIAEASEAGKSQIYFELNMEKVFRGDHVLSAKVMTPSIKTPVITSDTKKLTVIQPMLPKDSPLRAPSAS